MGEDGEGEEGGDGAAALGVGGCVDFGVAFVVECCLFGGDVEAEVVGAAGLDVLVIRICCG